jgi:hypothetical protein
VAVAEGRFYDSTVGSSGNGDAKNSKGSVGSAAVKSVKTDSLKSVNTKTVNGGKNQNQDSAATENGLRVLRTIPSIVYGQAVVTMAKGGAESQSYQVFCEMLEAGVVPSTMTTNNVIMELSKKGSYKVAIAILDQLVRYQVSVSTAALNSLFNACDKVCTVLYCTVLYVTAHALFLDCYYIDRIALCCIVASRIF